MTLTEHAMAGAALRAGRWHRLATGLPWYRSMPFSALVDMALVVDGRPADRLELAVGGRWLRTEALGALRDGSWFVQDRHELRWAPTHELAGRASVVLRMRLHLPNLVGPDGGSVQVVQEVRADLPVERSA